MQLFVVIVHEGGRGVKSKSSCDIRLALFIRRKFFGS